jgi:hypothetical protein
VATGVLMNSSRNTFFRSHFELSEKQIESAALYWYDLLINPIHISSDVNSGKKQIINSVKENEIKKLDIACPGWDNQFLQVLTKKLKDNRFDGHVIISTDYGAQGLLLEVTEECKIPSRWMFPNKLQMRFDNENNLLVNGERFSAKQFLEDYYKNNDDSDNENMSTLWNCCKKIKKTLVNSFS